MNKRMVSMTEGAGGTAFICPCCNRLWRVMENMAGQRVCDECAGLAPTDNQEVTEAMIEDGRQIASDIMNANVSKRMNGLGGSQTWDEWLDAGVKNRDLAIAYVNGEIDSVTAIYKAMQRAKLMPNAEVSR